MYSMSAVAAQGFLGLGAPEPVYITLCIVLCTSVDSDNTRTALADHITRLPGLAVTPVVTDQLLRPCGVCGRAGLNHNPK
jgi:hypothetical protein